MTTAAEVVEDAMAEITVSAAEQPLTTAETRTAIRMMNDFMLDLDINGSSVGYTKVTNLGDTVTIADGLILALKKNLAVLLAPQYGKQVSADLLQAAQRGVATIKKAAAFVPNARYPSTLPVGSGNQWIWGGAIYGNTFFPDEQAEILTENTGPIALEDDTP